MPRLASATRGAPFVALGLQAGLVPAAAIRFADEHGLRGRMYNDLEVGSYLTLHQPRHPVFQDPRINGYPDEMHAILKRDDLTVADWRALLDRFGVTSALVTYPDVNPRAALFDPTRWALVYRDAEALLFAARRPEFAALIAGAEIPLAFRYTRAAGSEPTPLPVRPEASPVPACEWARRLGDVWVELGDDGQAIAAYRTARATAGCLAPRAATAAALALGDAALRAHDPATAAEAYAGVALPRAHRNRGLALLALDRPAEALLELAGRPCRRSERRRCPPRRGAGPRSACGLRHPLSDIERVAPRTTPVVVRLAGLKASDRAWPGRCCSRCQHAQSDRARHVGGSRRFPVLAGRRADEAGDGSPERPGATATGRIPRPERRVSSSAN